MRVTRRRFLQISAAIAVIAIAKLYLDDKDMRRAPEREGKLLADLHNHPSTTKPLDEILRTISWGITGLTSINKRKDILTYDLALQLDGQNGCHVTEVDKGLFARVEYKGNIGYVVRAQEIMSPHHILAVGVLEQLPDYSDSRRAIEEIQRRNGLAILDHPYVVVNEIPLVKKVIKYRLINAEEEKVVRELFQMADEAEVFNGQCINLVPVIAWMNRANHGALKLAQEYGKKGTAGSDAHARLEQIHVCGEYVRDDTTSIEALKHRIKSGEFERHEAYVGPISFIRGHFLG